ncbi:dioxygenase [Brevirhabdus pacifica]|uniref:Dioxygenase n=1 Tax=Brevirhabdus pacifica TaxID=1267768 RepID=A0A1U7DI98_9RHOB|nr:VOC family protein [Brevirhabdus pacifica]APX89720.1 dioxygenase [Brevirhabdus pacifica]OWU74559.1 dioxygenase [Loktanella sp. 22II-4b]PJJ85592.1 glyoxalase family protein [Brevirhabdus pacifica]
MLKQIKGLHHVTSLASSASANNRFFTDTLGLRRVKKTVNFDAPDVYHLYYGDEVGTPGTVMTYFPFPDAAPGKPGVGEVGTTAFAVPVGSLPAWAERLSGAGVHELERTASFGEERLEFDGPDGERLALVETADQRTPWTGSGLSEDMAIRGFHSASMRLRDEGGTAELLRFMGYEEQERQGNTRRLVVPGGNAANVIDLETLPAAGRADQGAGSVHHIAFSVENREKQLEVRQALLDTGYQVTPVIDRDYFWAIYFRTPGGILFEVATNEPGFDRDEDVAHLGEALRLPSQHEHLRARLGELLEPIEG